ncbi:type IV toxin-antitoxin system YeeU family antitoxin [Salmonella enterica subsp. enterica serovar Redlands]|nr:type IV toxin-antitoxin system YeeU family antitoxin [Salmonella enterica]EBX1547630.1 type IV toxin-antitoxin system YeeU family antitoxin [Salmonella enterica subsp. enterica serovar Wa]ECA6119886.1 type IV toxin-antitoxin system YeeU family antitoxin [Salmonella enterica subsp. enterica serovar Redlands]ECE8654948.1 type IV toxin-antitoxin system YeeU family antitoxin [Salmonella enterica subsp. enterica]EBK3282410.1 type IV toxin-antitoxin system YeeU family antitoxin [Salmonella enteric
MSDNPDSKQPDNQTIPCIRGRLLQDGCLFRLQTSRDDMDAAFTEEEARWLDQAFPVLLKQLELMLLSGELNPRHQHCVTLYAKGLVCEADSLGSHGYIYVAIYPGEPPETGGMT